MGAVSGCSSRIGRGSLLTIEAARLALFFPVSGGDWHQSPGHEEALRLACRRLCRLVAVWHGPVSLSNRHRLWRPNGACWALAIFAVVEAICDVDLTHDEGGRDVSLRGRLERRVKAD